MLEIKLNKSNNNPFYGLKNCIKLLQDADNPELSTDLINNAWNEVKDSLEKRQMFFSLLFSIGDVTNRQHNIFLNETVDNGGFANRNGFETILMWIWNNARTQFKVFLWAHLFNEYSCFDVLLKNRVKTIQNTKKIISVFSHYGDAELSKILLEYVYAIINRDNVFDKMLVAKFLTIPRLSRRKGKKPLQPATKNIMLLKANFIFKLSEMMGWEQQYFAGYRKWRKQYNGNFESVLFSTQKILEFDRDSFLNWFDHLPADARARVISKVYSNPKWEKLLVWISQWKEIKAEKQKEQRLLEYKILKGEATKEDRTKLAQIKKEAKVTTGATNFSSLYNDILNNNIDKLRLESFIDKVNLPYNTLVIIDDSGSMTGAPFRFASFIASVCLAKNPDLDARNLVGFFGSYSHWHSNINYSEPNQTLKHSISDSQTEKPFIDPNLSFYDNYINISRFCNSVFDGGCTNLVSILESLTEKSLKDPRLLEQLKKYPVWTIMSDGELNHCSTPDRSLNDFFRKAEMMLGFKPYLVMMDICPSGVRYLKADTFAGIDNVIYIPSNPAMIEQFLTNMKEMDVYDVYSPLLSIYRSNRYQLVRNNTI